MRIDSISFFQDTQISQSKKPKELLKSLFTKNQGFYQFFNTKEFKEEVIQMKEYYNNYKNDFDDIVVCGIGGSALGLITIIDSVGKDDTSNIHILENIDPDMIHTVHSSINYERTLFIFISKSGGTIETLAQYSFFTTQLKEKNIQFCNNCVIITGDYGFLREQADSYNIPTFSIPENIVGRFSVLTSVGLFPSLWKGVDIDALILGAMDMNLIFQSEDEDNNILFQFAQFQYCTQKPIQVLMPYSSRLRSFALWYAQLLAESTGKEGKGFTMLPSVGPTDQHSQLQLFSEGPQDKAITILSVENFENDFSFTTSFFGVEKSFSFSSLLQCECMGSFMALQEKNIPLTHLSIEKISEYELGQLFFFFKGTTAFLGEMMEINAFNQPGVERGKVLAKEMLLNS